MMVKKNHNFHMVDMSPWPLLTSFNISFMLMSLTIWFAIKANTLILFSTTLVLMSAWGWWRDVKRESANQGIHTLVVLSNMKLGMIMFIISEILFFFSFFWAFFHSSLSPSMEMGLNWPPSNIVPFNPTDIPLLNTIILLSSGVTLTASHNFMLLNFKTLSESKLTLTILLGLYFTMLQGLEYWEALFCISDSAYGATFFVATGFHGLHVIIGTLFLLVSLLRSLNNQLSKSHHFGFEAAAWYWHFVDVVWLFLYVNLYWWGN